MEKGKKHQDSAAHPEDLDVVVGGRALQTNKDPKADSEYHGYSEQSQIDQGRPEVRSFQSAHVERSSITSSPKQRALFEVLSQIYVTEVVRVLAQGSSPEKMPPGQHPPVSPSHISPHSTLASPQDPKNSAFHVWVPPKRKTRSATTPPTSSATTLQKQAPSSLIKDTRQQAQQQQALPPYLSTPTRHARSHFRSEFHTHSHAHRAHASTISQQRWPVDHCHHYQQHQHQQPQQQAQHQRGAATTATQWHSAPPTE